MKNTTSINPHLDLLIEKQLAEHSDKPNMLYYSEFKQAFSKDTFLNVGIKYVAEGIEYYNVSGSEYMVKEKHFLLASKIPDTHGFIDSKTPVKGICIDIDQKTISDTFRILSTNTKINLDDVLEEEKTNPYFFEHISFAGTSALSGRISKLEKHLTEHDFAIPFVDDEWFLETAEELICEQHEKWKSLNRLEFLKDSTKKEVIRRLLIGKEYMDIHFMQSPDIKTISKFCCLSEFHFFRSFKDAFCITPYQYILKKKLEFALELLTVRKMSISEISSQLNFTDIQAFSNAFKKRYGLAPSKLNCK
ncbi:MAG: helix-turn-helix transcriptional regulator [Saprospiraceae bacterium]|nr:helix-turn-helix transcriptional regulator [Saprospiraceae bacterium]